MKTISEELKDYDDMVAFSREVTGSKKYSILPGISFFKSGGKFQKMFKLSKNK